MSIRFWIGRDKELFKKPRGLSDVEMSTGFCGGEAVLSISRDEMGERRAFVIGGGDILAMLKLLAHDRRYRQLFSSTFLETVAGQRDPHIGVGPIIV